MSASAYKELEDRKVKAIAEYLTKRKNVGKGIRRDDLSRVLSTPTMNITTSMITSLWPRVEHAVQEIGMTRGEALYAVRPQAQWDYLCSAQITPLHTWWSSLKREKNVVTRLKNDLVHGIAIRSAIDSGVLDRAQEMELRMYEERGLQFLSNYNRREADIDSQMETVEAGLRSMDRITF